MQRDNYAMVKLTICDAIVDNYAHRMRKLRKSSVVGCVLILDSYMTDFKLEFNMLGG